MKLIINGGLGGAAVAANRPVSYAKGFIARQYRCAKKPVQLGYSA
jgi:hypothetical protein